MDQYYLSSHRLEDEILNLAKGTWESANNFKKQNHPSIPHLRDTGMKESSNAMVFMGSTDNLLVCGFALEGES
jgi:hypothetical protein